MEKINYTIAGRLWLKKGNKTLMGKGKAELLKRLQKTGSILKSAKEMKMSYKAAWDDIDALNSLIGKQVVSAGRNGSFLTDSACKLLEQYRLINGQFELFIKNISLKNHAFTVKITGITHVKNFIHYTVAKEDITLNCIMPFQTVFKIGEEAEAILSPQRLIAVRQECCDGAENVIRGSVKSIKKDTVNVATSIGNFNVRSKLKAAVGTNLALLCTAQDIWLYSI